ncbi:LacI family DNA-binding transcriptional regulator [Paenibacillus sp. JX-17]|uniref:LacI family DNA-binding transcriptional regulator n=2 Tax=Paenibacillus lacisoli TaxID=3064525 RepID=A0ABT9C9M8_9BACL|nr:LacI family DNA-binding transcriptional regulator [Paenibacillus sp. JX-17]
MATRKEVAELAGVSEATVSRVLNGVGPIRKQTREKVLSAARELGYTPNSLARNLALKRSGNLGVIMPYLPKARLFSAYYFSEILNGIGSKAQQEGYDLLMIFRNAEEPTDYEELFRMHKVDGLVILGAKDELGEREALRALKQNQRPFCVVNQHFDGEDFPEVDADHVEGSYAAAGHLLAEGYRRIAFLNGPVSYSNSVDRRAGYERALADYGMIPELQLQYEGNFSRKSGLAAARDIAARLQEMDAVFAANDRMAIGLIQGLEAIGTTAAEFPAIVGYDDSDAAEMVTPALTSVRVPFFEIGETAAGQVLSNRAGVQELAGRILLPTKLVVRASSLGSARQEHCCSLSRRLE